MLKPKDNERKRTDLAIVLVFSRWVNDPNEAQCIFFEIARVTSASFWRGAWDLPFLPPVGKNVRKHAIIYHGRDSQAHIEVALHRQDTHLVKRSKSLPIMFFLFFFATAINRVFTDGNMQICIERSAKRSQELPQFGGEWSTETKDYSQTVSRTVYTTNSQRGLLFEIYSELLQCFWFMCLRESYKCRQFHGIIIEQCIQISITLFSEAGSSSVLWTLSSLWFGPLLRFTIETQCMCCK